MSFEKLLAELAQAGESQETVRKALAAEGTDDKTILAAGGEGGTGEGSGEGAGEGAGGGEGAGAGDDKGKGAGEGGEGEGAVAKSFQVTLPDGSTAEAQDGTVLIKALTDRVEANESQVMKALESAVTLIKGQGEMLKALNDTVKGQAQMIKAFGGEGRGRKTTLVLNERGAGGGEEQPPAGLTGDELMAKAMAGQKAGHLMAHDVSTLEIYLGRRAAPPEALVAKILAANK